MTKKVIHGPILALSVLALATFALPAQAQNQGTGLETAAQAAGDGTSTFDGLLDGLEGLFESTPDEANTGLQTARDASATGGEVSGDRLQSLRNGDTALGRPPTLAPMPVNIGRPPVQTGPPPGVGGARGGRF